MREHLLTLVFREYFASNRGPDSRPVDYGVDVSSAGDDLSEITLEVTFKRGKSYCCTEPGCHFGPDWSRLRSIAARFGVELPSACTVRFRGVVESGSICTVTDDSCDRIENVFHEYEMVYTDSRRSG
jgi:hypothetical protein